MTKNVHRKQDFPPWGEWEVLLDTPSFKVKRILVKPGARLSYQRHAKRSEHWLVVQGQGSVTLNDQRVVLQVGQSIDIPSGSSHRMANEGIDPLVFIEVQLGSYFGEDDIERLEDDYGRSGSGS